MPRPTTEDVQKAIEDVRDAARAVLALPTWSADLVQALHRLVMRAGKAAAAVLLTLPREQLARVKMKRKSRTRARKRRRRSRKRR
jgi:hypothetical protein